jgi:hypothetical protein
MREMLDDWPFWVPALIAVVALVTSIVLGEVSKGDDDAS